MPSFLFSVNTLDTSAMGGIEGPFTFEAIVPTRREPSPKKGVIPPVGSNWMRDTIVSAAREVGILCRTANQMRRASISRRPGKSKFSRKRSNTPRAQKNNCGCRRRRRRTIPDEERGGSDRSLPREPLRAQERPQQPVGRPPLPDDELVAQIKAVIAELPTYGYWRVHAILKRRALAAGLKTT